MTSGQQMLLGGSGNPFKIEPFGGLCSCLNPTGTGSANIQFFLHATGLTGVVGNPSSGTTSTVGARWYATTPPQTFYVRATLVSGTQGGGSFNVWNPLNVSLQYSLSRSGSLGMTTCTIRFDFSTDAAGSSIFGSQQVSLRATIDV